MDIREWIARASVSRYGRYVTNEGIVVVTTSYPKRAGDAEGHFVAAEVRRLCQGDTVTVLAPGSNRPSLFGERVVSLGGGEAFGFPGALERLRQRPWHTASAAQFCWSATRWLQRRAPRRVVAHFLLPCAFPIATYGLAGRGELEVVIHGSDARLFARLPRGHGLIGAQLVRARAQLRFVSAELYELVLARLPEEQRAKLAPCASVAPAALDVDGVPARAAARGRLGLESQAKVAVVVARLVPGKRVDVALEACRRVKSLRTIVLGDGPELSQLKARFPEARFVGHVERPVALSYISAADVLVSASLHEGAPSVVREARALGTDVVCLAAGDLQTWAENDAGIHVVA
jgi:glycosyltransferase involved in cell wall biosynthesis